MILNKLKYGTINNKKYLLFLVGLAIIGLISGSIFTTILSSSDKNLVKEYMTNFINNTSINEIDYLNTLINSCITNFGFIIAIWLLGISVIGVPIILFLYFFKIFILGFSISSFILTYKIKGLILAFIYIFPYQIISLFIYTLITLYALKISANLIYSIFGKKEVNYKKIINRYLFILLICIGVIIFSILYETFVIPFLFNKIAFLVK
jgi:stage II sporulation protein M